MKRSLVFIALASVGATSAFAQSSVTLYGRVNTSIESQKDYNRLGRATVVQNNSSRWGLRGSEDMGGGLKANFKLESGFGSDDGTGSGGFGRESWVGLSGGFGAVKVGNLTVVSALYYATSDYIGMHNHETGTSGDAFYDGMAVGNMKNAVSYTTPNFGGVEVEAQWGLKETNTPGAKDKFALVANHVGGPLHLGAGYASGPTLAAAFAPAVAGLGNQTGKEFGVRALYFMGPAAVGATYISHKTEQPGIQTKRDAFRVAAMYGVGNSEFHANVGMASKKKVNGVSLAATDALQYTLGYNYNLSKRTKLYAFYSAVDNKANASYAGGGADASAAGKDPSQFAVGVRHNF